MEKVKNFVIKYQLWFKLAAIALLICVVSTPYVFWFANSKNIFEYYDQHSLWSVISDKIIIPRYGYGKITVILCWISFILTTITILSLVLSIVKKNKFITFTIIIFFIDYLFLFTNSIYTSWFRSEIYSHYGTCIPSYAFIVATLLFISAILILKQLIQYKKTLPKNLSKTEQIAELEKRIEQLERERQRDEK